MFDGRGRVIFRGINEWTGWDYSGDVITQLLLQFVGTQAR